MDHAIFLLMLISISLTGCNSDSSGPKNRSRHAVAKGEYIYRTHDEFLFRPPQPIYQSPSLYPWEDVQGGKFPPINKYYFRCKGCGLNPPKKIDLNGEVRYVADCNGPSGHSLPLKDGEEYIYPIFIDLLNYLQRKTDQRVIITSGHRCPTHHAYVEQSKAQMYSKHMIGAEVDFYIQNLEEQPEFIVALIQDYFLETPYYRDLKEYQQFNRWEKANDISTPPWYNKEIFIKLYKKNEGRNLDNDHPYPYISIQIRYDKENNEKVSYSWDKAFKNFYRH